MLDVLRLYYKTYKCLEDMASDLAECGLTDTPLYREYSDYRDGYELARAELLDELGITIK